MGVQPDAPTTTMNESDGIESVTVTMTVKRRVKGMKVP